MGRASGHAGPVTDHDHDHDQRWAQIARLLHDTIDLTDRVAGALLLLLYGQHLTPIVAITHDQIKTQGPQVFLQLGTNNLHIPNRSSSSSENSPATAALHRKSPPRTPPTGCSPGCNPANP
jgi:hypothetical protein